MLNMVNRIFWAIYSHNLREAAAIALVLSFLWAWAGRFWGRRPLWRGINALGTACITAAILYATVLCRSPGTEELVLVPFQFFAEAKEQPEVYRSVLMNVILFMPFGLTIPYILPMQWRRAVKVCLAVAAGLCLAVTVEYCQYRFTLGRCEADDVIMNTLGALLGALPFRCFGVSRKKAAAKHVAGTADSRYTIGNNSKESTGEGPRMNQVEQYFLEALKAALQERSVKWESLSESEWNGLFALAEGQHVLPMVFQAAYRCPAAKSADPKWMAAIRKRTMQYIMIQTRKVFEFMPVYEALEQAGVPPLVVKGAVCRALYPQPDQRISGDEDLLIPPEHYKDCDRVLLEKGMTHADLKQNPETAYEVPFRREGGYLHIELHKSLFPPESEAYGDLNRFFEAAEARSVTVPIQGMNLRTLCPTDHLLYLILHAFKHFLHSGFGIRQVCDVALFANTHGAEIDWAYVLDALKQVRAERFAAAMLAIGERYLTFDPERARLPEAWRALRMDETPLLEDLLSSGAYGNSSESRLHSSNMTLHAVAAEKKGTAKSGGIRRSLFPPRTSLQGHYPYLEKHPYLLPVAWTSRILRYGMKNGSGEARESIRIGSHRVELLREYGIIE